MKKYIFILMAVVLAVTACNEQEELIEPVTDFYSVASIAGYTPLTEATINQIADVHNPLLDSTLGLINLQSENLEQEVLNVYEGFYNSEWNISSSEFESSLNIGPDVKDSVLAHIYNQTSFLVIYNSIISIGNSGNSYYQILNDLDNLKSTINSTLVDRDKDAALLMLETSKRSAYYWLPAAQGGSGVGHQILTDFWDENDLPGIPDIGKAMVIDGLGSVWGFLLIGFLLAPTPPTLIALVGFVGLHAARASVMYMVGAAM